MPSATAACGVTHAIPNYFGESLVWWGLFLVAAGEPGGWVTVVSPTFMTWLLLRVSGVTLLEAGLTRTKPGYADYVQRTSAFVPWPPRAMSAAQQAHICRRSSSDRPAAIGIHRGSRSGGFAP